MPHDMIKGLATVIYRVTDIERAKSWYSAAFQQAPYFDQPFYVGFNVGGYELGLLPDATQSTAGAYWGVKGINAVYARLLELGAAPRTEVTDVGEGIRTAEVLDPFGNVLGIIENPHFKPAEAK